MRIPRRKRYGHDTNLRIPRRAGGDTHARPGPGRPVRSLVYDPFIMIMNDSFMVIINDWFVMFINDRFLMILNEWFILMAACGPAVGTGGEGRLGRLVSLPERADREHRRLRAPPSPPSPDTAGEGKARIRPARARTG